MLSKTAALLSILAVVVSPVGKAGEIDCGFFNEIEISDPHGDATPGAPSYVDILGLTIRQFRDKVQFRWWSDGNPYNPDRMYEFIFIDSDRDPQTGAQQYGIGIDIKIGVNLDAYVHRFDEAGNWIGDVPGPPVVFKDDGFVIEVDRDWLGTDHFTVYFATSGAPAWADNGSLAEINLEASRPGPSVIVQTENFAVREGPTVINIPSTSTGVQLTAYLKDGVSLTELTGSDVKYNIFHASPLIQDAESIISIDEGGSAHYNSPGFVYATAEVRECGLQSDLIILATGDLYTSGGNPQVLAIWPTDHQPLGIQATYQHIMTSYPDFMHAMNTAYLITSDLYKGFRPFGGDKQIFAAVEVDSMCHAGNPILSPPACYFNGNGGPSYVAIIHEMGHNFQQARGMSILSTAEFSHVGFGECSASLPVIYMFSEITENGGDYGLGPGSYEWEQFNSWLQRDGSNFDDFDAFEAQIAAGQIDGLFDEEGPFDGVAMFCCIFQAHIYGHGPYSTVYGHELIRRFLNVFADQEFDDFDYDNIETYFAAAFSAAAGKDLREKFRFWGFEIDDEFYDQIMPMIESRIELFADRFEFANLNTWDRVVD